MPTAGTGRAPDREVFARAHGRQAAGMSFINFSFTQNFTGTFAPETAQVRVGFSREGGRLEVVERLELDGSLSKIALNPKIEAAANSVRDAITATTWLDSVTVDRRVPGADPRNVTWTERHGGSGLAPTGSAAPTNVQQAITAATLLADLVQHAPVEQPFVPHP
jgi:hypothetical protein